MRAFVITGPGAAEVVQVPDPVAVAGEVVVDVALAGVCGTDVEFWTGHMEYLHNGSARYPVRIGQRVVRHGHRRRARRRPGLARPAGHR